MVRRCVVCRISFGTDRNRSYHRTHPPSNLDASLNNKINEDKENISPCSVLERDMGKASSSAIMLASTTLSSSILSASETERYCIDTTPSSSTVTASEARELFPTVNTSSSTSEEIKTEIRTRKRRYPMHFGECKSSDMDNPKQAKINWQIAKKKIHIQDRKIRSLQQSNRRLKSRIYNLNSLLTLLKQKYSLTETAGSLITVIMI
ncbi:hypothetical protein NQ315_005638 [Exocentrus adspersus]|uniref:Uncharacterized protein n=1 Tax=Exocentrus adspersus TaxID=1586481 RepID=A0AAV8V6X5_9CUCU|nr:hypothetical protein NQ315_005638 [Exocentrus adspersus]